MNRPVTVEVIAINGEYGYSMIELKTPVGDAPMSFVVHYNTLDKKYHFSQSGENNTWICNPDERK